MSQTTILHITTWYPNREDEQLGIFVQKHIEKGFSFSQNIILALISSTSNKVNKIDVVQTIEKDSVVIRVYYPENKWHKFLSLRTRQKAIKKGVEKVLELNYKIDAVHCHIAEVSLWIAFRYFSKYPVFLIEHWSGFVDGRFDKIPGLIRRGIVNRMNKCEHIFVVSQQLKTGIEQKGIRTKISIIPNVIERKHVKHEANAVFTFGVVADLIDSVKNISGIFQAFAKLKNDVGQLEFRITIIGDGKDAVNLKRLSNNLLINQFVEFKGRMNNEDVLLQIPTFDVLIVNSYKETYSMVTAEALLSGVPVIATKCGGPEQFINEGINGFLVEVDNVNELCEAMRKAMVNENFKKYAWISDDFSSQIDVTKLTSKIIHQLQNSITLQ